MARPREFDEQEALVKAVDVFWDLGYENASLPDILDGMGLTRGSLYKAFKDKKHLFLMTLEKYNEIAVQPAVEMLTDTTIPDGLDRIEALYGVITSSVRAGDTRGCLMCVTASGAGSDDPDITEAVDAMFRKMLNAFEIALRDANNPNLSGDNIRALSDSLLAQYVGLRTMARAKVSVVVLDQAVRAFMRLLRR